MESTATQDAHFDDSQAGDFSGGPFLFDVEKPLLFGEVFHIALEQSQSDKAFPMRVTVSQTNYNPNSPNWYAITFSEEYSG